MYILNLKDDDDDGDDDDGDDDGDVYNAEVPDATEHSESELRVDEREKIHSE